MCVVTLAALGLGGAATSSAAGGAAAASAAGAAAGGAAASGAAAAGAAASSSYLSSLLIGASLAVSAASAITGYVSQSQQAKAQAKYNAANAQAAQDAMQTDIVLTNVRMQQEVDAASKEIFQSRVDRLRARGQALASTGNVQGVSVGQLLNDFDAQQGRFADSLRQNQELRSRQLELSKLGIHSTATQRIAGLRPPTPPNAFAHGLNFAGNALGTLTTAHLLNPKRV